MENDNVSKLGDKDYGIVADLMFQEYNVIAEEYNLPPIEDRNELKTILADNVSRVDIKRLKESNAARMALAGTISSLLMNVDIFIATFEPGDDNNDPTSH